MPSAPDAAPVRNSRAEPTAAPIGADLQPCLPGVAGTRADLCARALADVAADPVADQWVEPDADGALDAAPDVRADAFAVAAAPSRHGGSTTSCSAARA